MSSTSSAAHAMDANRQSGALEALKARAAARSKMPGAYAGEVTAQEAWDYLSDHADAVLVDVRTQAEWQFVGAPDLGVCAGSFLPVSWKLYPTFATNPNFEAQLRDAGVNESSPVFFLCRSGGRSLDAAIAMTAQGFGACFNVIDGFEGEPDGVRHRGTTGGWKAAGLPWAQS